MKQLLIILLALSIGSLSYSQKRVAVSKSLRDHAIKEIIPALNENYLTEESKAPLKFTNLNPEEEQIGETRYDNQSNASIQNRIYLYDDGTIGATWTRSMDEGSFFADRGTGYNYYDGNSWSTWPEERVEAIKTSRPSYTAWGENGEMIVSHVSEAGLLMCTRDQKGTGDWNFESFTGPVGQNYILWNRAITSGADNNIVHLLVLTLPTSHGGTIYEGLDGALLYSLSLDGGNSWYWENTILDDMTSDDYAGFTGDNYTFAEPRGDVVAFVVGDNWYDLFLMKSTDGGETFEKTIIWQHPYPMWEYGMTTDTFYCADGAHSLVIDENENVHVAFGISRNYSDDEATYWFPFVDGIAYWNETMPAFSNNLNALNPNGGTGSELIEDYNLIGWTQDVNGNGQIELLEEIGNYYIGLSSMPQLILDDLNRMFLIYSSATETYESGTKNYRHIWARGSEDGGVSWQGFFDQTSGLEHIFDECVYPSCASNSDENIYLVYQSDNEPGTAVWGQQHPYVDNKAVFMKIPKSDLLSTGINENQNVLNNSDVSQNYPNPFSTVSVINVNLKTQSELHLEVNNLTGQKVYETEVINGEPGMNKITIDAGHLKPGVYFYTVKAGEASATKKMTVK